MLAHRAVFPLQPVDVQLLKQAPETEVDADPAGSRLLHGDVPDRQCMGRGNVAAIVNGIAALQTLIRLGNGQVCTKGR